MRVYLAWSTFKTQVSDKGRVRYNIGGPDGSTFYTIQYTDAIGEFETSVNIDGGADQTDFDNNYAPYANKEVPVTPFAYATPTHRTKFHSTSAIATCPVNVSTNIDWVIPYELYLYGGEMIVENAELGDYLSAEVNDVDSIIPSPYRAALCEAWPTVAAYNIKRWIRPKDSTGFSFLTIDTRPLIAKVTAALYLRITYHAINTGADRNVAVNYFTLKKL